MNDEVVKALRNCARPTPCAECPRCESGGEDLCVSELMNDAADAIEKLIQIANHHEQSAKDWWKEARDWKQKATALSAEVERLKGEHNGNE